MRKEDITFEDKLSELRLDLQHPNSDGHVFILVEGDTDIRTFRKLFREVTCNVEYVPGGKIKLEEALEKLAPFSGLLLGIRDKDFLGITGGMRAISNLFYTDCHDMEMTILSLKAVRQAVLYEFTGLSLEKQDSFWESLMTLIKPMSIAKLVNITGSHRLNFQFGIFNFVDSSTKSVDIDGFIERGIAKGGTQCQIAFEEFKLEYLNKTTEDYDLYQLTNGHDLIKVLQLFAQKEFGQTGLQKNTIEAAIRVAFNLQHFQQTSLYKSLHNWQIEKQVSIFP